MKLHYRLYTKIAFTVLFLFIALAGVLLYTTSKTSERYALEITQRVNRDIALHAAQDMPIFENNAVNQPALKELAHHVMFINPIVEVYLLDLQGNILSHALPHGTVEMNAVAMQPLQQFLDKSAELPIFGDDPRNPGQQAVFSISPVMSNGVPAGYLYTVLNGGSGKGLRESLQDSYNLRAGAQTIIASLFVAVVIGLLIFSVLTKRLQHLLATVRNYREGSYEGRMEEVGRTPPRDELDELGTAIYDMSLRIESQIQALEDVDHTRRELIANVSHDLRTPLASMQGYIETLIVKGEKLSEEQRRQFLGVAHKHSKRLNELVSELFELSKLESSSTEPKWEKFPLMELVHDTVQEFSLRANERDIDITAQCADSNAMVVADIAMIQRVLDNLLDNAMRHTPRGGSISLLIRREAERVRIEVKDTGRGISSHDIPHIFDRFYRPETESAKESEGHGLGLAIVKRILELHRSTVDVYSEPDHGTAFVFWLPQHRLPA